MPTSLYHSSQFYQSTLENWSRYPQSTTLVNTASVGISAFVYIYLFLIFIWQKFTSVVFVQTNGSVPGQFICRCYLLAIRLRWSVFAVLSESRCHSIGLHFDWIGTARVRAGLIHGHRTDATVAAAFGDTTCGDDLWRSERVSDSALFCFLCCFALTSLSAFGSQ